MNREEQISNANPYGGSSDIGFGKMVGFNAGAKWADKHPVSSWISIEERLPEKDGTCVWVKSSCLNHQPLIYHDGKFYARLSDGAYDGSVTHWMPIPKLQ